MALLFLPPTFITLLGFTAFFVYILTSYVISYRKLRQFKGPFLASLSQCWLFKATLYGRVTPAGADALKKYGSPVRIGPNLLLTDDPALMRAMSAPRSTFIRGTWYEGARLDPRQDQAFSTRNEDIHNDLRAKMVPGYSGKETPNLESNINARVLDLIALIRRHSTTSQPFDMSPVAQYFTMDTLTHVAFGYPFGYLQRNEDIYGYLASTRAFMPVLELSCNHSWFNKFLNSRLMQSIAAPTASDPRGMGAVVGVAQKVVQDRFKPDAKRYDDMLSSFIDHGLSQAEAESESLGQIIAGADSTASAIRMTLLHVLANPPVYAKLLQEIDAQKFEGAVISSAEAKMMPYLQACIREGLRIMPPLQSLFSKLSPPEGARIDGLYIPGDTNVAVNFHAMMRRGEVFGADAEVFRPERWTEADEGGYNRMDRTVELVFGTGRFTCLGKTIAKMELDKVFVELLRNFNWGIANPINAVKTYCNGAHVQSDYYLTARAR